MMATEPYAGEKLDQPDSPDESASAADPYWVADVERNKRQLEFDQRERAVHAAMHPTIAGLLPRSIDDVLADAAKIHKFMAGAE